MTTQEFSNEFDILYNNIVSNQAPGLDEYEKSVFLTKAQEELVVNLYNGKLSGDGFEMSEENRRFLDNLVGTKIYTSEDVVETDKKLSNYSTIFQVDTDIAFITLEQVTFDDESLGCDNGKKVLVYATRQDEYTVIKDNPFKGPSKRKVLRIDTGRLDTEENSYLELISKYKIGEYLVKYVRNPNPIILENLENGLTIKGVSQKSECELNPILHQTILERAVQLASAAYKSNSN